MKNYNDYATIELARQDRANQLIQKYSQKPVQPRKAGLWMATTVERSEHPTKGLGWVVIAMIGALALAVGMANFLK